MNEQAQLEIALIENVQRQDLSPLEAAQAYARLNKEFNTTFEAIAERIGKSSSTINNIVRLLNLPPEAQVALARRHISEGHARAILALDSDPQNQLVLLEHIIKEGWSVRKAEQFVKGVKQGGDNAKDKAVKQTATETPETKQLAKKLQTTVRVYNMAKGGRLIIDYKDEADLKRITTRLS
jgi:ParB family chromosome partitioning protein